jgi:hypothetical protein
VESRVGSGQLAEEERTGQMANDKWQMVNREARFAIENWVPSSFATDDARTTLSDHRGVFTAHCPLPTL